ncbi:hypothetical protein TNCV_2337371 [Trichonephila clavipes]|nr:hypothetical protein TNCV_2337371 [Trichonephila clavipes]
MLTNPGNVTYYRAAWTRFVAVHNSNSGHNVSTMQRCATRWIQEDLRARRRRRWVHRYTSARTNWRISQLTIRDPFSPIPRTTTANRR